MTGAGGDLRLILGQLQMVRLRARSLSYDEVSSGPGPPARTFSPIPTTTLALYPRVATCVCRAGVPSLHAQSAHGTCPCLVLLLPRSHWVFAPCCGLALTLTRTVVSCLLLRPHGPCHHSPPPT